MWNSTASQAIETEHKCLVYWLLLKQGVMEMFCILKVRISTKSTSKFWGWCKCSVSWFWSWHHASLEKQQSSRKISALLTMPKPLTLWITTNCGKFWKRWEYQTTWPVFWETCRQDKKQQIKPDMEQRIGFKLEKEYDKAVYCHSAYYLSWRVHHVKCQAGWTILCNQDCQEK